MEKVVIYIIVIYSMYLFIKKRLYFDFLSLMFFATLFYFLPFLCGFVTIKEKGVVKYISINSETYNIAIILFLCILIVTYLYDKYIRVKIKQKVYYSPMDKGFDKFCIYLFCIISILFYMIQGRFMIGKIRDLSNMIGIYKIWSNMILILGGVSIVSNNKLGVFLSILGAIFDLYLGDRTIFVILVIVLTTYILIKKCNRGIIYYKKIIVIILLIIAPLVFYKKLIGPIQRGDIDEFIARITNIETYTDSIVSIEPFTTQCILNEVISKNYKIKENTLVSIKNLIPLIEKTKYSTFNEQMQKELFEDIEYGMGSNVWAEVYSNLSIIALYIMILIYLFIGVMGNILFEKIDIYKLKVIILISFSFFIFYIHRNSIVYQINLNLRVIYLYIGILFIYRILKKISKINIINF
ncbi:hypothetical protein [Clostridium cuniculi]|uniref:hypothetical protein n=1 Tax=Clostridium cuniculi TaxID=2548455 RepID=UPI001055F5EA|nr:hypothetical protein [Clostridium cuniculi]